MNLAIAGTLGSRLDGGVRSSRGRNAENGSHIVPALTSKMAKGTGGPAGDECQNLVAAYGLNTNRGGNADSVLTEDGTPPITRSHGNPGGVMIGSGVRRLTPTECLRLQGLPDNWFDGVPSADSRKYAGLGDAVTANVAAWIGRRLLASSPGSGGKEE